MAGDMRAVDPGEIIPSLGAFDLTLWPQFFPNFKLYQCLGPEE